MPVIGFLSGGSPDGFAYLVRAFREGLSETGYVEGQNVAIEFRWADGQYHRLPNLLADLVDRQVKAIAALTINRVLAAKAASKTVPIVFATDGDPVQLGLVASLSQPGGNVTGVTQLNVEVAPKRVELAHDLIPSARSRRLAGQSDQLPRRGRREGLGKLPRRVPGAAASVTSVNRLTGGVQIRHFVMAITGRRHRC